jgi:hypothetical protein
VIKKLFVRFPLLIQAQFDFWLRITHAFKHLTTTKPKTPVQKRIWLLRLHFTSYHRPLICR